MKMFASKGVRNVVLKVQFVLEIGYKTHDDIIEVKFLIIKSANIKMKTFWDIALYNVVEID
jgi:hypothetical protein